MPARIASINTSAHKGEPKISVSEATLSAGIGIDGDAHAGSSRQVSLLAIEAINSVDLPGITSGAFGENITTAGIDLTSISVGQRLRAGKDAIIQISQLGKICHSPCSIGQSIGDCIMPREGVFAKVNKGGNIKNGDIIELTNVKIGAVLTSSDRCTTGERQDESGPALAQLLQEIGVEIADYSIMPDNEPSLAQQLVFLADSCALDVILTTGGTGFSLRDRMPEATATVIDTQAAGIAEAIRHEGLQYTPLACISRGISGLRGRTLIINLPGSKRAITQVSGFLKSVIPHALDALRMEITDCGPVKPDEIALR